MLHSNWNLSDALLLHVSIHFIVVSCFQVRGLTEYGLGQLDWILQRSKGECAVMLKEFNGLQMMKECFAVLPHTAQCG